MAILENWLDCGSDLWSVLFKQHYEHDSTRKIERVVLCNIQISLRKQPLRRYAMRLKGGSQEVGYDILLQPRVQICGM